LGYCDASRMPLRDRHNRHLEAIIENQHQIPSQNPTTGTTEAEQEVSNINSDINSEIGDINGDLWGLADSPPTQSQTNNGSTPSQFKSQFKSKFKSQSQSQSQSPASNHIPVENQNQPVEEDSTKAQTTTESIEVTASQPVSNNTLINHAYGQNSVQRLLVTLFPHRQSLNKPLPEED
jgi:carbon dioxide concentrating mechanism protein CcmN